MEKERLWFMRQSDMWCEVGFWTSLSGRHSKRLSPAADCWFKIALMFINSSTAERNESYRHKAEGWPTCQTSLVCRADLWLSVMPGGDWADVWKLDFQQFTPRDYANWGHLWPREIWGSSLNAYTLCLSLMHVFFFRKWVHTWTRLKRCSSSNYFWKSYMLPAKDKYKAVSSTMGTFRRYTSDSHTCAHAS